MAAPGPVRTGPARGPLLALERSTGSPLNQGRRPSAAPYRCQCIDQRLSCGTHGLPLDAGGRERHRPREGRRLEADRASRRHTARSARPTSSASTGISPSSTADGSMHPGARPTRTHRANFSRRWRPSRAASAPATQHPSIGCSIKWRRDGKRTRSAPRERPEKWCRRPPPEPAPRCRGTGISRTVAVCPRCMGMTARWQRRDLALTGQSAR